MLCGLGMHRVDPAAVWNGGVGFSRCLRCHRDLMRQPGKRWMRVQPGSAVTLRPADGGQSGEEGAAVSARGPLAPRSAGAAALPGGRLLQSVRRLGAVADRPLAALAAPRELASRSYRYLVRRIAAAEARGRPVRTVLLSALCDPDAANEALLMLSAMMQDELGGTVLIVDATLHGGGFGSLFAGVRPGLSEARPDDPEALFDLVDPLSRTGLFLLGPGFDPASTCGEDMAAILPLLAARFDRILIQQHAVTADTRYLPMAAQADLVLALAEEGRSRMADLHRARCTFRANGIENVGLVLTVPPIEAEAGARHG